MKSILATLLVILVLGLNAQAQFQKPDVSFPSPNAASLGTYGEIPVSLFTGLPQISIPLYTTQEQGLQIPIILSYHASGVRPDAHPGWVGLGWTLQAGGVITRKMNDEYDESDIPEILGYYHHHAISNTSNWNNPDYLLSISGGNEIYKDTEPDEFTFNFMGISGSFYMNSVGEWQVKSNQNIKVIFNENDLYDIPFSPPSNSPYAEYGYRKVFGKFTLITDNGYQYVFGGTTDAMEYSIPFFSQYMHPWMANSWFLTEILTPDNHFVKFTYERGDFINQMHLSLYQRNFATQGGGWLSSNCVISSSLIPPSGFYDGQLIAPVYLSKIETTQETILFKRSRTTELRYDDTIYDLFYNDWARYNGKGIQFLPFLTDFSNPQDKASQFPKHILDKLQWHKLDTIQIKRKDGSLLYEQILTYNNQEDKRLKLLKVQQRNGTTEIPPYEFRYDESYPLPPYLENQSDHWGFYNGTTALVDNYMHYYTLRSPHETYMKTGSLLQITYPTGGYTLFEYEPHDYAQGVRKIRNEALEQYPRDALGKFPIAGGLRVKKITSMDDNNQKIEKEYLYVKAYQPDTPSSQLYSSGVLNFQTQYYWDDYRVKAANDNTTTSVQVFFFQQRIAREF